MKKLTGKKIRKSLYSHQWVEDILYFEGPLLSLLKASTSQDYFYYHVDQSSKLVRWLAISVSRRDIDLYITRKRSLRWLVKRHDDVAVVDMNADGEVVNVVVCDLDDLPSAYLPPRQSMFDPGLSQISDDELLPAPGSYTLKVDGQWFFEDLAKIPKYYIQLYSFFYSLVHLGRPSVRSNAYDIYRKFPWRGGFSSVNFYRQLQSVIPSLHEPEVSKMHYASPGEITLELLSDVAERLRDSLLSANENASELDDLRKEFGRVQRAERWAEVDGTLSSIRISKDLRQYLSNTLQEACRLLGIAEYSDDIRKLAGNELVAVKIILSYSRRILKLTGFTERQLVQY